jgi:hypothetical protein
MQQLSQRKEWIDAWESSQRKLSDAQTLPEIAIESDDE